jgi:sugar lactone lactonase YvrE
MRNVKPGIMLVIGVVAWSAALPLQAEVIPFDSSRWVSLNGEVAEFDGRLCRTGSAFLPNIAFVNGIIEYDVMLDGSRGYPGVTFRAASQTSYEHIYIRPHAGLRGDGIQYAPAFGPGSDWQLYHGPGYTAAIAMPTDRWLHVRIEILGQRARVFFDNSEEPVLLVEDLKHEARPGPIGIRSAPGTSARFANFQVTKTDDLDFPPLVEERQPRGLITSWEVSQSFKMTDVDASAYPPAELLDDLVWTEATTEPGGLLNISRHAQRSFGGQGDVAFVRTTLEADQAGTRKLSFGYSDYVTVFLNGQPIFSGNNAYRSRNDDHPGVISLEDQLHLNLNEGENELLFAVAETFGGWGLMAQDNEADFIHPELEQVWQLETGNRLPEAVVFDPARKVLYVSQYFQGGNEFLSKVGLDGEVLAREWISGFQRPTGMHLDGDRLWVVDRRNLVEVNVAAGKIAAQHPISGAAFPNDVTADDQGILYITDTAGSKVYRFSDGDFSDWLDGTQVQRPNGIKFHQGRILVGESDSGRVLAVDPATGQVSPLENLGPGQNVDGICPDGQGGLVLSAFEGLVFHRSADGQMSEILNLTASGSKSADLMFIPEQNLLVVPGLYDNRLTGYRWAGWPQR